MTEEPKQEITNAVLAEQIKGLTKITDERFSNLDKTLTRIEGNSNGFASKSDLEEFKRDVEKARAEDNKNFNDTIKSIYMGFEKHNENDEKSFGGLDKNMDSLKKTIWMAMGGIAVVVFFIQVIYPIFLRG